VTVVDAGMVRAAEFPPGIDVAAILRPTKTRTWEVSSEYRRAITRTSPLLHALTYLGPHLRQQDSGLISFSQMHLDMCAAARRWMKPGPLRDAWIGPREIGKSFWAALALPLWALSHDHKRFLLLFSYVDTQAKLHVKNLLDELRSNDLLLMDFPNLALVRGQSSADRTVLKGGATIAARGMGGTSLGIRSGADRPSLIVSDDVEPGEVDNSPAEVEKNKSRLLRNVLPMNTRAVVQVCGTVTRPDSLVHGFVHAAKGRPDGAWVEQQQFVPHHYPALLPDGTSLWPQRWSVAELERMRDEDPHGYALNYDNDPLPDSELTYWKPEMFQFDRRFPTVARVLHIDVAVTTNKTSDYTVLTLVGQDASRQRALVEDVRWGRWTAPEIREQIHDMCGPLRVKPLVRVEATQGGATWLDSLAPWPVGVTYELTHPRAPKAVRIGWALKHYTRRAVWHPWPLEEFQAELCRYPRGAHDDVPDSLAGALEWAFPIQ
jgi:phage terminase large subunit-like protein